MRYLALYRPGKEHTAPPSQQQMEEMGKFIHEMAAAGVLIATEGCQPSSKGMKIRIENGKFTTTDGPFAETKEVIGGFCLFQVKSKEEAVEWTKRFLKLMGEGESEVRLMPDTPAYSSSESSTKGQLATA